MRGWGLLAPILVPAAAAGAAVLVLAVHALARAAWRRVVGEWRAARRVLAETEHETARHIGALVPDQREPSEPPAWWGFVPKRDEDDR
jgi:hypothetical protein